MYRIRILSVGKTKETWLEEAISEYLKRLQHTATIEFVWLKNDDQLISTASKESHLVCLDAAGQKFTSEQFSTFVIKQLETNGSKMTIVIGGAEGLPPALRNQDKHPMISLSPMTFTHQVVRLILIEQIYRAFEIEKGSRYHK